MEDLFSIDTNEGNGSLLGKPKTQEGLFKPKAADAKDPNIGYRAVIRFIPNIHLDGKIGENSIERITQYVKLEEYPNLKGTYDSMRNFNESCDLTNLYLTLDKSPNIVLKEKAKNIQRTIKYYSYIQIIEDKNNPENEGRIMIFPAPKKVKELISHELTGEPCNIFDLVNGKNFTLMVKGKGMQTNYDFSKFADKPEPIRIPSKDGVLRPIPVEEVDGKIVPKVGKEKEISKAIFEYITNREVELETFAPKRWDDETKKKVAQIVSVMTNNPIKKANSIIENSSEDDYSDDSSNEISTNDASTNTGDEDFFDF